MMIDHVQLAQYRLQERIEEARQDALRHERTPATTTRRHRIAVALHRLADRVEPPPRLSALSR